MKKMVSLNGKKICTYSYGKGPTTLVLLSGSGVPFPNLEYMSFAKALAEACQVILIEKLGYGYSDLEEGDRTIGGNVQEYRDVLQQLEMQTPVILAAHSMGFLEALYWGQQHPSEIAGIIGIDPATPECYRDFDIEEAAKQLIQLSNDEQLREKLVRTLTDSLVKEHRLSSSETKELEQLAMRNLANQNWISEATSLRNSILQIEKNNPYLQLPMLFFISNGEGTTLEKETWRAHSLQYLKHIKQSQYALYDLPHTLYKTAYQEMAQTVHAFITKYLSAQ